MTENVYDAPASTLEKDTVYCRECGNKISRTAITCGNCGAEQNTGGRSKVAAGLLAIFLGGFGFHRFYLGQWWGIFYLLFFWAWLPGLIAFVEGIVFLCTSNESWNRKYGNTKGSSVIALVIGAFLLIFVIGILAAIAIPAYQEYVTRAQQAGL